jgi:hypothetical protein
MIIIPERPEPPPQTPHSRELARRVEQEVRDYKRQHPELTEDEVRSALMQSTPAGDSTNFTRRKRIAAIAMGAAVAGAFGVMASNSSGNVAGINFGWKIVGVCAAVLAVAIAAIRIVRRT